MGQTAPKNKGKISRMLAAKASLCARVDALGEESAPSIGIESRAKVEDRVRQCEQNKVRLGNLLLLYHNIVNLYAQVPLIQYTNIQIHELCEAKRDT